MTISDIIRCIEGMAPLAYQEHYDNAGLCVGEASRPATGALLCLDVTEAVVDEAIERNANLIVSHHPVVFSGLKRICGQSETERIVMKAIAHGIALYAAHTNLDSVEGGISWRLARKLGLERPRILSPLGSQLVKLVAFVPTGHLEAVRHALFDAGAGHIGGYDQCSFAHHGEGTFRAGPSARPFVGARGVQHREQESRLETIAQRKDLARVLDALRAAHPYEEVAYDIVALENGLPSVGMGVVGELAAPCRVEQFFEVLKSVFHAKCVRTNRPHKQMVGRVAVCGGSGSGLVKEAIAAKADILVTGDCKYHQFIDAGGRIILADIGHYESESFAVEIFYDILSKNFPNFAVYLSEKGVNPVLYA